MQTYLSVLFGVALLLVAVLVGVNYCMDPYAMSGVALPAPSNAVKPTFGDHHGLGKPFVAARRRPTTVVFGTSRENHGINPDHATSRATEGSHFNLAMDAANIADVEKLFEHARAVGELREIVIGLDFLNMFDGKMHGVLSLDAEVLRNDARPPLMAAMSAFRYFVSWQMLRDSLITLRDQDPLKSEFEANGRRNGIVFDSAASRFGQRHMFEFSETRYFRQRINLPIERRFNLTDRRGQSTLLHLAIILDHAAARNIDVKLFIAPVHARQLEVYRLLGLWSAFEDWKQAIVSVAEGGYLRSEPRHFDVYDFADYNELTAEAVPAEGDTQARMQWYWESSHYTVSLGNLVLDRIFGRENAALPDSFGVLLSGKDMKVHLSGVREHGDWYRHSHPDDVRELERNAIDVARSGVVVSM